MALQEQELLPLAERVLTAADWAQLDAAFTDSRDPLTGGPGDANYHALFNRIAHRLPAAQVGPGSPGEAGRLASPVSGRTRPQTHAPAE